MTCDPEQINFLIYLVAGAITANALSLFLILFALVAERKYTGRDMEMLMVWFERFKELKDREMEMEDKKKWTKK